MALEVLLEAFFFVFCVPFTAILNNILTYAKEAFLPLMGNRMRTRARCIRGCEHLRRVNIRGHIGEVQIYRSWHPRHLCKRQK